MKTPCTELTRVSVVISFHCLVKWFRKVRLRGYSNTVVTWRLRREWHAHVKSGLSLRINTGIKSVYYLNMFYYPFYLWYLCLLLDGRLFVEMWAWCRIGKIAACVFMSFWHNCNLGTSNARAECVRIHTALAPDWDICHDWHVQDFMLHRIQLLSDTIRLLNNNNKSLSMLVFIV